MLAGEEVPEEERYDGYLQLENGVGNAAAFEEFEEGHKKLTGDDERQEEHRLPQESWHILYKRHGGKR